MSTRNQDTITTSSPTDADTTLVREATNGDESAFATLSRRYRRELHVHCYRMLASFEDAEDLVQETFLRAWQKRETYAARASYRAWLYRIATNACLDFLEKHENRVLKSDSSSASSHAAAHVPWLQPYPDRLLEQAAAAEGNPDSRVIAKETIQLAFLVAMQFLPPKQRAVLILRDVLDWTSKETAVLLDTTEQAVNAALYRARETLREHRPSRARPSASDAIERALAEQYAAATERVDMQAIAKLLKEDVTFSMPPEPFVATGRDKVVNSWIEGGLGSPPYDAFKCLIVGANGMPAVANYIRKPGDKDYSLIALDVLRIEDGMIAEITAFFDLKPFGDAFALPDRIS